MAAMIGLTSEQLGQIGGGYVVWDEKNNKYWIVREDGTVVAPAPDEEHAVRFAKVFNTSPEVLSMAEYKQRFGRDLVW